MKNVTVIVQEPEDRDRLQDVEQRDHHDPRPPQPGRGGAVHEREDDRQPKRDEHPQQRSGRIVGQVGSPGRHRLADMRGHTAGVHVMSKSHNDDQQRGDASANDHVHRADIGPAQHAPSGKTAALSHSGSLSAGASGPEAEFARRSLSISSVYLPPVTIPAKMAVPTVTESPPNRERLFRPAWVNGPAQSAWFAAIVTMRTGHRIGQSEQAVSSDTPGVSVGHGDPVQHPGDVAEVYPVQAGGNSSFSGRIAAAIMVVSCIDGTPGREEPSSQKSTRPVQMGHIVREIQATPRSLDRTMTATSGTGRS